MAEANDVLASDAEREAAVARLREEAAAGRLDTAEFERRIDLAYRAQTRGEPARLAADLPAPAPPPAGRLALAVGGDAQAGVVRTAFGVEQTVGPRRLERRDRRRRRG